MSLHLLLLKSSMLLTFDVFLTRLRCSLISLALHEANPGHHLQASYLLSQQGLPEFRKSMEDRNYCLVNSPSYTTLAFKLHQWPIYAAIVLYGYN